MVAQFLEGRRPGRHGEGIAGECPGLEHLPGGKNVVHDLAPAAVGPQRKPTADDLPQRRQIGGDPEDLLRPAVRQAKPSHHLVEYQQRPVLFRQPPGRGEEIARRDDEPHVADDRLENDGRDLVTAGREQGLEVCGGVVVEEDGVARRAGGDAGGIGNAEGGGRRPGGDEQRIDVAMVIPSELDDAVAAGESACEAHGAHRRLGAGAHHPHLLDRRHRRDDQLRQVALPLGRRAVAGAPGEGPLDRRDDAGMTVAEDHRAPGADVVEILQPVDVGEPLAFGALEEDRLATDSAEGPGRGIDPAGNEGPCPGEGRVAVGARGGRGHRGSAPGALEGIMAPSGAARSARTSSTRTLAWGRLA